MTIQDHAAYPASEHIAVQSETTPEYDSETAALMRCALRPVFEQAESWADLIHGMRLRGYKMCFRRGRLCLIHIEDGARLCGLRFLGLELRDLVARLGRPVVLVRPDGGADGDLLEHAPGDMPVH